MAKPREYNNHFMMQSVIYHEILQEGEQIGDWMRR